MYILVPGIAFEGIPGTSWLERQMVGCGKSLQGGYKLLKSWRRVIE